MKFILDVSDDLVRVTIKKKMMGYEIDLYSGGLLESRSRCIKSKKIIPGTSVYTALSGSRHISCFVDFSYERTLGIGFFKAPDYNINY